MHGKLGGQVVGDQEFRSQVNSTAVCVSLVPLRFGCS